MASDLDVEVENLDDLLVALHSNVSGLSVVAGFG